MALLARIKHRRPSRLWSAADLVLVSALRELDPAGASPLPPGVRHTGVVWQGFPTAANPVESTFIGLRLHE